MDSTTESLPISLDRDSVCAGDDCESHERPFAAPGDASASELVTSAAKACGLPTIVGGKATWIVEAGGYGGKPIAVIAQQWDAPRMLEPHSSTVQSIFGAREARLFFKYWCQANPEEVFDALSTNSTLPDRHG